MADVKIGAASDMNRQNRKKNRKIREKHREFSSSGVVVFSCLCESEKYDAGEENRMME